MRFHFDRDTRLLLCDGPSVVQDACADAVREMLARAEEEQAFVPMTTDTLFHIRAMVAERIRQSGREDLARQVALAETG